MTAVQRTAELRRILALPRRSWSSTEAADLAVQLTTLFRTPNGCMTLRPIQAVALAEAGAYGGLFAPIAVGGGKTLVSLLLSVAMGFRRPLLLLPANLIGKTKASQKQLSQHWQIPKEIRLCSYEWLGQPQGKDMLEAYRPDGIIADEAHRLKNLRDATVAKRVMRYHTKINPDCRFAFMTGSASKRSPEDYGHLVRMALRTGAPIPRASELEDWAAALGEHTDAWYGSSMGVGALLDLCGPEEAGLPPLEAARNAYRRRLVDTPGVVATSESALGCSLRLSSLVPPLNQATEDALELLRTAWELPSGETFMEGPRVWATARQLSLGLYYRWDPPAPRSWLEARREWYSHARHILSTNRRNIDSPKLVQDAVHDGLYPEAANALKTWLAIEDTFTQNTVAVWLDDGPLEAAARWAAQGPGIIWTEQTAFAHRLARRTGLPYYGRKGRDQRGRPIPEFDTDRENCGKGTIIASIGNRTGRNLQGWNRNLVTSPPPNGEWWEQLLGRTHRELQPADEVSYEIFTSSPEQWGAIRQSERDAVYIESTIGQTQKISYADKEWTQ